MIHHTHTDTCRQTKTECLQQLLTGKGIKNLGPPESNSLSKNLFNITNTTHKTFCSKNEPVLQQIFDERRQVKMPQKKTSYSRRIWASATEIYWKDTHLWFLHKRHIVQVLLYVANSSSLTTSYITIFLQIHSLHITIGFITHTSKTLLRTLKYVMFVLKNVTLWCTKNCDMYISINVTYLSWSIICICIN